MSPDKLIYMANQIAGALRSRKGEDPAAATADHISNFWEPRMRAQLFKLMDEDAARFDPIVREARERIRPVRPTGPDRAQEHGREVALERVKGIEPSS
jgi:formate dehydrogenase subunit delta